MQAMPRRRISSYHAHIYFRNTTERAEAARLREQIAAQFAVQMGSWHEKPIGPHQHPMYQVAFDPALFAELVPWLMLNRQDLVILLHPNTDNPRRDHLHHPIWFGEVFAIVGPERLPETQEAEPVMVNTSPSLSAES